MERFITIQPPDAKIILEGVPHYRRIVLFLGSTLSVPAPTRIPSVCNLKHWLLEGMFQRVVANGDQHATSVIEQLIATRDEQEKYSLIDQLPLEAFFQHLYGVRRDIVEEVCAKSFYESERCKPNFNHLGIARLVRQLITRGDFVTVLTTNYDLCLENAFRHTDATSVGAISRGLYVKEHRFEYAGHEPFTLFKLHGSAGDFASMVYTFDAVSTCRTDPAIDTALQTLADADVVLVAGYSASDLDLRPLIMRYLTKSQATILWCNHDVNDFWRDVERQSFRKAFFDSFGDRPKLVLTNLLSGDAASNIFASYEPSIREHQISGVALSPSDSLVALGNALTTDDIRVFLAMVSQSLELPSAASLLKESSRLIEFAPIYVEAACHGNKHGVSAKLAHELAQQTHDPWSRTQLHARAATYATIDVSKGEGRTTSVKTALWLNVLGWASFVSATQGEQFSFRQITRTTSDIESVQQTVAARKSADSIHHLLHNLIRIPGRVHGFVPRPYSYAISFPWRLVAWYISRWLERCALFQPTIREEAAARREAVECLIYTDTGSLRPPHLDTLLDTLNDARQLMEQVESVNGLVSVELTFGRLYTFRQHYDEALHHFLEGLRWALGRQDVSLSRKCAGNAARVLRYLSEKAGRMLVISAPKRTDCPVWNELEATIQDYKFRQQPQSLYQILLVIYVLSFKEGERDGALDELRRKNDIRKWPFFS